VGFAGKVSGPGYEKFGGSFKSAGGSMVSWCLYTLIWVIFLVNIKL
jgi:hypothetical protein